MAGGREGGRTGGREEREGAVTNMVEVVGRIAFVAGKLPCLAILGV